MPAVVVLSPKVDTTFAKGVIRVATTIFGATLGESYRYLAEVYEWRRLVEADLRGGVY
jgi:hypothetical protein